MGCTCFTVPVASLYPISMSSTDSHLPRACSCYCLILFRCDIFLVVSPAFQLTAVFSMPAVVSLAIIFQTSAINYFLRPSYVPISLSMCMVSPFLVLFSSIYYIVVAAVFYPVHLAPESIPDAPTPSLIPLYQAPYVQPFTPVSPPSITISALSPQFFPPYGAPRAAYQFCS